jgi:uncharacterized membrane protein YwzB
MNLFSTIYLITFLGMTVVILKIFLESNMHQLFKQGRISQIRLFYLILSVILSYLFSSALIKFMEEVYNLI